jgi:hypothetical protein
MAGRPGEEKTVERVKNPEDGTYSVWQAEVEWTRPGSSVEGEINSMRVADWDRFRARPATSAGRTG